MALQIGQKSSPTFRQPIDLMSDCHRRVESFLRALIIVAEQAVGGALNEIQRDGLQAALRYFREAAPKHTADEEESLFPRLRALSDERVVEALEKVDQLEKDHQIANISHQTVEQLGQRWLVAGNLNGAELAQLLTCLYQLRSIYERHIAVEDNEVFPLAKQVLSPEKLTAIGEEMAKRRGQVVR